MVLTMKDELFSYKQNNGILMVELGVWEASEEDVYGTTGQCYYNQTISIAWAATVCFQLLHHLLQEKRD